MGNARENYERTKAAIENNNDQRASFQKRHDELKRQLPEAEGNVTSEQEHVSQLERDYHLQGGDRAKLVSAKEKLSDFEKAVQEIQKGIGFVSAEIEKCNSKEAELKQKLQSERVKLIIASRDALLESISKKAKDLLSEAWAVASCIPGANYHEFLKSAFPQPGLNEHMKTRDQWLADNGLER